MHGSPNANDKARHPARDIQAFHRAVSPFFYAHTKRHHAIATNATTSTKRITNETSSTIKAILRPAAVPSIATTVSVPSAQSSRLPESTLIDHLLSSRSQIRFSYSRNLPHLRRLHHPNPALLHHLHCKP